MQQLDDEILQKIAKEMNLSETAFVLEKNDQDTYDKGQNISASVFFKTHLSLRSRYKFSIHVVLFFQLAFN